MKFTHCLFATFLIGLSTLTAFAQTRTSEVANAELSSVIKVLPDATSPTGVVILYNPSKCQQIGLACDFLLTHEHRRIALGYQPAKVGALDIDLKLLELEADKSAAMKASPQVWFAGWQYLQVGYAGLNFPSYGPPRARARRICEFARQAGNWIGEVLCR